MIVTPQLLAALVVLLPRQARVVLTSVEKRETPRFRSPGPKRNALTVDVCAMGVGLGVPPPHHERLRVVPRQRLDQNGIHQAKTPIGADAEGGREHRRNHINVSGTISADIASYS